MAAHTDISWADRTWNPVDGCTKVSPGCEHCYAENIARRFAGSKAYPNGFDVTLHEERLTAPLRWRKPARVFVNSMSDLFHAAVPELFLARVFDTMEQAPHHTFLVLTKRHGRMRSFLRARQDAHEQYARAFEENKIPERRTCPAAVAARRRADNPPANIWVGVSVEDQKHADLRIPALLETPAAVRWLSCEPLLGPVDLFGAPHRGCEEAGPAITHQGVIHRTADYGDEHDCEHQVGIDWVVVGGESGHGARPMHPDWARHLRDQCATAGVAFHFKQRGAWTWDDPHWPAMDWARNPERHAVTYPDGRSEFVSTATWSRDDGTLLYRVGKKAAGRELDGRTWDQYPAVPA